MRLKRGLDTISRKHHGLINGYRSGLEEKIAKQIEEAGLKVHYESNKLAYCWPSRNSTYTPDFLVNGFYIETKGRFTVQDRQKHLLVKEQCPDIEIRFVFSNQNQKLYRGSPTTYAQWCEKHGFMYAHRTIPDAWLTEGDTKNEPK